MSLDQQLEQSAISTTNGRLAELKSKALEMGAYYYHEFIDHIGKIQQTIANSSIDPKSKDTAEGILSQIEKFYEELPEPPDGREEFSPILTIKEILPRFKQALRNYFTREDKAERGLAVITLGRLAVRLTQSHESYHANLLALLHEIRDYPNEKDFVVPIKHPRGYI